MADDPVSSDVGGAVARGRVAQALPPSRDPEAERVAALVVEASAGSQEAWDGLVARYTRLVWAVPRALQLSEPDAADVAQTTWLRLVEHLGAVKQPERLGSWLGATARRETLRLAKGRDGTAERPADHERSVVADGSASIAESPLTRSRDAQLYHAVLQLSDRCQRLLRVLSASPPPRYETVSEALGLPIGSIGPTRGRCLVKLRRVLADQGWFGPGAADDRRDGTSMIDHEVVLLAVADVFDKMDPPPQHVAEAARTAFSTRTHDHDLLPLRRRRPEPPTREQALDDPDQRRISFGDDALEVDVGVRHEHQGWTLAGQVSRPVDRLWVQTPSVVEPVEIDGHRRFYVTVPPGPVRLKLLAARGRRVQTDWVTL